MLPSVGLVYYGWRACDLGAAVETDIHTHKQTHFFGIDGGCDDPLLAPEDPFPFPFTCGGGSA